MTDNRTINSESSGTSENLGDLIPARVGQAAIAILRPLARLFIAHGVKYAAAEAVLKQAFLEAGENELKRANIKSNISRVSVTTGLHRRDVKRLGELPKEQLPDAGDQGSFGKSTRSLASEVYLRWSTDPAYQNASGSLPLRAQKGQISFETLARAASSDAHPRSMLEELRRLGLVRVDKENNCAELRSGGFVPLYEQSELVGLLGENVSAHIETAVANVVDDGTRYLEQSICEDQLSDKAIEKISRLSRDIWGKASKRLVPALTEARQTDQTEENNGYQLRVGMYLYTDLPRTCADSLPQREDHKKL